MFFLNPAERFNITRNTKAIPSYLPRFKFFVISFFCDVVGKPFKFDQGREGVVEERGFCTRDVLFIFNETSFLILNRFADPLGGSGQQICMRWIT